MAILADDWLTQLTQWRFLDNSAVQWLGLIGLLAAALVAGKIAAFWLARKARLCSNVPRLAVLGLVLKGLAGPVKLLLLAGGLHLAGQFLTLQRMDEHGAIHFDLKRFWEQLVTALAVLAAGWFIYRLVDIVEHFLHRWAVRAETKLDEQLVPLIRRALRALVVIAIALFVAQNVFSWNIGALLAGLGIGGLAIALAAQSLLADIFGSLRVLADKPFRMGETIRVSGHTGSVEEMSFRSTRIRTADGDVVTIPNSVVAAGPVEVLSRRSFLRHELKLVLASDTPSAKLNRGLEIVHQMLEARKDHFPADKPSRAFFSGFGVSGLNLVVFYWFTPAEDWAFMQFKHEFNMELLKRFAEEGVHLALAEG